MGHATEARSTSAAAGDIDELKVVAGATSLNNPENYEGADFWKDWSSDNGTLGIGVPTSGPGAAHQGSNVVATILAGNYGDDTSSRLVSPPFIVPPTSTSPRLRFWHWFSFSCADSGQLQIKVGTERWQTFVNYTSTSSGVWSRPSLDLSPYGGQAVQIGFYFESHNDACNGSPVDVSSGWYIDEVRLLHDFALLLLDSPVVRTQDTACVSLAIAANAPASNVNFTVQAPDGPLGNVTLSTVGCWSVAGFTPLGNSQWSVSLENGCTFAPMGVQTIGSLCFTAISSHSAFIPFTISDLSVTNLDASLPPAIAFGSRSVVIANESLLEAVLGANDERWLTLYGKANTSYENPIHHQREHRFALVSRLDQHRAGEPVL